MESPGNTWESDGKDESFAVSELVAEEIQRAHSQIAFGEADFFAPLADVDELSPAELAEVISRVQDWISAHRLVERAYRTLLAERLERGGAKGVRYGGRWFVRRPKTTNRIVDGQLRRLVEWLGDDLTRVVNIQTGLRIGALRDVIAERDLNPEVIETFVETEKGEWELTPMPVDKAPKYVSALEDGGVR